MIKFHHFGIQFSHFGGKTITVIVHARWCTDSGGGLLKWPLPSGGYDSCWLIDESRRATIRRRAGKDCRMRTRRRKRGDWKQISQITYFLRVPRIVTGNCTRAPDFPIDVISDCTQWNACTKIGCKFPWVLGARTWCYKSGGTGEVILTAQEKLKGHSKKKQKEIVTAPWHALAAGSRGSCDTVFWRTLTPPPPLSDWTTTKPTTFGIDSRGAQAGRLEK